MKCSLCGKVCKDETRLIYHKNLHENDKKLRIIGDPDNIRFSSKEFGGKHL